MSVKLSLQRLLRAALVVAFVLIISFGAVIGISFWKTSPWRIHPPSDQTLIAIFKENRSKFEKLVSIKSGNERDQLLSTLNPVPHFTYSPFGTMGFIYGEAGSAISLGWAKGIEHVPDNQVSVGIIKPSLDDINDLPPDTYVRQLEPHWYIFYQKDGK